MDFLKQPLGEELYNQLVDKLKDNKEIKLGNLATGQYVDKSKYDTLEQEKNKLNESLTQRDNDLKVLKENNKDNTELQTELNTLTTQYDTDTKKLKKDLEDYKLTSALKLELVGKVHDIDIVSNLIDKTKLTYDEKQDKITMGLEEQVKSLNESKAFLFVENDKLKGTTPPPGGNQNSVNNNQNTNDETLESAVAEALAKQLNQ